MEEKQRATAAKKAEQDAYDRKLQDEIANYNPFGRGGAGAPVKDTSGNVVGKSSARVASVIRHSSTSVGISGLDKYDQQNKALNVFTFYVSSL